MSVHCRALTLSNIVKSEGPGRMATAGRGAGAPHNAASSKLHVLIVPQVRLQRDSLTWRKRGKWLGGLFAQACFSS